MEHVTKEVVEAARGSLVIGVTGFGAVKVEGFLKDQLQPAEQLWDGEVR